MRETPRSTILKRDDKGIVRNGAEWLALWSDPDSFKTAGELSEQRRLEAGRREIERRLAAGVRALSRQSGAAFVAPVSGLEPAAVAAARGEADLAAFRLRFHDPQRGPPAAAPRARLGEICEEVRCACLGARLFKGVEANLIAHHRARLAGANLLGAHLAALIPLAEALRMVVRDTLLERMEPSIATSGFRMWDRWLRARFQADLDRLRQEMSNQDRFGGATDDFLRRLLEELGGQRQRPAPPPMAGEGPARRAGTQAAEPGGALFAPDEAETSAERYPLRAVPPPYRAFTTRHDRIVRAEALPLAGEAGVLAARLERRRQENRRHLGRLAAGLQRRLTSRQLRAWSFDREDGLLDAARLHRVIVNPGYASAYKQESDSAFLDSAVCLLVDNSGSMRGKPIEIACLTADLIIGALERSGVAGEVLGFTTRAWKGGQSARDWRRAGAPANPGRLNDLLHIIYKSADQPLRRARRHLSAMLSDHVLKENIDGEALAWAAGRLARRPERRRLLIVISDGAPVDQATLEASDDKQLLDRHLRATVRGIEAAGRIELAAIGVRHDLSDIYRRAVGIDRIEDLGGTLVALLDRLLAA